MTEFTLIVFKKLLPAFFVFLILLGTHANGQTDPALILRGVAWSSVGGASVGWIKFSSSSEGGAQSTINYGVMVSREGLMSGAAWADKYGWLSFNSADLTGCPSGTCEARLNLQTNQMSGWARFLVPKNDPGKGAWDGWVSLSGSVQSSASLTSPFSKIVNFFNPITSFFASLVSNFLLFK